MSSQETLEWVALVPGVSVILRSEGRFSLYKARAFEFAAPFSQTHLSATGTLDITRALLEGAFVAGLGDKSDSPAEPPPITLPQVIYQLCRSYQTTHATPEVLRQTVRAFSAEGRQDLAEFSEKKLREEEGHDLLALKDLQALGLPAQHLVEAIQPPTARAMVAYYRQLADEPHPVGALGYAYALERAALFTDQTRIDATQAVCPPGVNATRCMKVHSAVGADTAHVEELVEFVAGLPAGERADIARETYRTAALLAHGWREPPPSDAAIIGWIQQAGGAWERERTESG